MRAACAARRRSAPRAARPAAFLLFFCCYYDAPPCLPHLLHASAVLVGPAGVKNRDFYQKRGYEIQSAERVADGEDRILVYGMRLDHGKKQPLRC